jgi:hypothetical protein
MVLAREAHDAPNLSLRKDEGKGEYRTRDLGGEVYIPRKIGILQLDRIPVS